MKRPPIATIWRSAFGRSWSVGIRTTEQTGEGPVEMWSGYQIPAADRAHAREIAAAINRAVRQREARP